MAGPPAHYVGTRMATWEEFTAAAPRIASIFARRHAATGNLCMLATIRPDGFPRISPMEPRIWAGAGQERPGPTGRRPPGSLDEGLCVQTLHIGPYDAESALLAHIHDDFIPRATASRWSASIMRSTSATLGKSRPRNSARSSGNPSSTSGETRLNERRHPHAFRHYRGQRGELVLLNLDPL